MSIAVARWYLLALTCFMVCLLPDWCLAQVAESKLFTFVPDSRHPQTCVGGTGNPRSDSCDQVQLSVCPSLGLRYGGIVDLNIDTTSRRYFRQIRCFIPVPIEQTTAFDVATSQRKSPDKCT